MKIIESQMEFDMDQSYSHNLKKFIKDKATERIKGFIENFLEKDLKERKKAEFKDFKEEFEEYFNCGEIYESNITAFPLEEQIKICQASDDFGPSYLEHFNIASEKFPIKITRDFGFVLNNLINKECFDFVCQLEKSMEEMKLKLWELTDANNLGWMAHKKEFPANNYPQVYCYRCIEGEMDFNTDVYELRFSNFNVVFEKSVEIPLAQQQRNFEIYEEFGP
ncbi:MAG: hypothetical protein ACTSRX_09995 [Promethearchaeota archaeon]